MIRPVRSRSARTSVVLHVNPERGFLREKLARERAGLKPTRSVTVPRRRPEARSAQQGRGRDSFVEHIQRGLIFGTVRVTRANLLSCL
jgi:hypothetical protein